jgi:RND family efflux transporter MFP subunit
MSIWSPLLPRAVLLLALATAATAGQAAAGALATWTVAPASGAVQSSHDGTVEAVRQTVVSAQVAGAVVALPVKAGDRVKAGQLLLRLDARAAEQQAGAAAAQVQAARAAQQAATSEVQRQRQLFQSRFISQAALDHAEAQYKAAAAQAEAQVASAQAARTATGYFTVAAPYDGIVSEVAVMLGDMAQPGRALLTLFDPLSLRVVVAVPESAASLLKPLSTPSVELAGQPGRLLMPARWEVLPAADPATHTVTVRLELPAGSMAAPGSFARAWLPGAVATARIRVPTQALVQRAELQGVYVVGEDGRALLRQVRAGPVLGDQTEILSGLKLGERVALDPQAAARRP